MQTPSSEVRSTDSSYFRVFGMSCPSCAKTIQTAISKRLKLPTFVDFQSNLIRVDKPNVSIDLLRAATQKMGFFISSLFETRLDSAHQEKHEKALVLRASVSTFFAMWILILSLSRYGLNLEETSTAHLYIEYAISILFLPVLFYAALPIYRMAALGARVKDYNIDTFITLEIVACALLSTIALSQGRATYFDSLAMSLSLLLFGKIIFFKMQSNQIMSIDTLTDDLPDRVFRTSNKTVEEVGIREVNERDCIEINQNKFSTFDGELISDEAVFDRTKFFGTSQSLKLTKGAKVLAGYQLTSSEPAQIKVTHTLGNRELDRLYISTQKSLIKNHESRLTSEKWLDFFIRATPLIALSGLLVSLFWTSSWIESSIIALSLLIILCPCAFAFGPPLAFGILRSALGQTGIDLRSKQVLEAEHPHILLFDKNGTLTQPSIDLDQSTFSHIEPKQALDIAASLERDIDHPIAFAFLKIGKGRFPITEQKIHQNKGVEANVKNIGKALLGSKKLMEENGIEVQSPHGFIHLAINGKLVSSFRLHYKVFTETVDTLKALKEAGYKLGVLTGDNNFESLPIDLLDENFMKSECSPKDKLDFLEDLIRSDKSVGYIGDGVNDSLIMARTKFSFSVSNASAAAKASAAVHLRNNGIQNLPHCLRQLKRCKNILNTILGYAFLYNAIAIGFAVFGFFNPATALLAMTTSSLLILISLSLYYFIIQIPQKELA